jgi:hypothetical protein
MVLRLLQESKIQLALAQFIEASSRLILNTMLVEY